MMEVLRRGRRRDMKKRHDRDAKMVRRRTVSEDRGAKGNEVSDEEDMIETLNCSRQ